MAHRSESDYARALKFLTTWLEERGDIEWLVQEVLGRYAELGEDRSIVEQLLRIAFPKAGKQPISGLIANVRGTILRPQYRRQSPFGWAGLSWGLRSIYPDVYKKAEDAEVEARCAERLSSESLDAASAMLVAEGTPGPLARCSLALAVMRRALNGDPVDLPEAEKSSPESVGTAADAQCEAGAAGSSAQIALGAQLVAALEALPESDSRWDGIDSLVEQLVALRDRNQKRRREAKVREEAAIRASAALRDATTRTGSVLAYLKLVLPAPPPTLDPGVSADLEKILAEIIDETALHEAAREAVRRADNEDEERARRAEREAVAARVRALVAHIAALLGAPSGTTTAPGPSTAQPPQEKVTITDRGIPSPDGDRAAASSLATVPPVLPAPAAPAPPDVPTATGTSAAVSMTPEAAPPEPPPTLVSAPQAPRTEPPDERRPATLPEADGAEPIAHPRVMQLLSVGDVTGAYWYTLVLETTRTPTCVSSDILAVLQAARWLDADGPLLAGDIIDRVDRAVIGDSRPARLLATAAALVPALTEPSTKLLGWLERDVDPSLAGVVAAITAFANQGRSLSPWILQGAHDVGERDRTLREVGAKVARWLEDAPQRRTGYQAASKLWQVMFERLFRDALLAARDNRIDRYDAIADMCQRLRTGYDEEIDDLDRSLRQAHFSRIQEPARSWLYQMIRSTLAVLDEWLRTAELTRQLERQDWMLRLVHELRRDVEQAMSGALVGAAEMISSGDVSEAACGFCLADSLRRLCGLLSLDVRWPASLPRGATEQPPLLTALLKEQPPNNLLEGLAARLLWCPPSRFDPGTDTLSEHASGLLAVLDRPVPAVEEAFAQWVDAEAFDRAERLATFVRDALRSDMNGRRDRARLLLEQEVEALRGQVEQAVVDGYVGDERSELLSNLGGIEPQRRNDLATARDQTRAVKELLDRRLDARLARAMNDWEDLRKEAQQRGAEAALLDRWTEHLQAARRRGDVRVLDERLARLREWQARGEPIGDVPPASPSERQAFNELVAFRQASTAVLRQGWGMVQKALRGEGLPGLHLPPEPARGLAFQALEQWFDLKRLGPGGHADALIARVAWILRFVGYNAADLPVKLEFEKRGGSRWMAFRADLEDGEASPVPQFGSMPRGRYRVICVWEGAGVDLGAILAALPGTEATIFIYLGAMSDQMRSSLRLVGAQRHIALVCMDEVLIYFLAGESADRLRTFYACTLPYAHINPYTPFQAGEVPREMYFGRKAAVQKLMAPEGGCIVYGGRQLGKSALLREVCRKFHHPERDQYAVVIDVQHVGDAGAQVDTKAVWPLVRDRLRELKLVETKKTRPEDIVAALREALLERPNARLLLLLDEADKLLDADAKDGFVVIDGFRQLMAETNRRFKVVLAGLHSVQRFQQLPNQPLAHFGESIQVGPLEPRDAEDLVTKPLSALGYEFESRDDVLRILSYTNYHPGLIQIFCQDLLEQLRNAPVAQLPPLKITREQVNRVYQRPQVRRRIQERFDWTLALDLRYQAIAWSVIVEESGPQQRRGVYRTGELLAVVRSWWPKGFAATTLDEFHGLLDEMCGLGVLVGTSEVGYRLRSPNIAQLMGDVGARLLELSEREPPSVFDVDRQHRKVGHEDQFSPLTLGQERQLFAPRWAPVLVFGSTALGINTFFPSLRGLEGPRLTVARADLTAERGAIEAWLRTQELPKEGVLVIAAKAPPDAVGARGLLEEARRVCRTRSGSNMHGRVVITFDEAAATAWSQLPSRSEVEGHAESTLLLLRKWSAPALKARLISRELLATEQHLRRLLEVTGGWAMLVDAVFLQMKTDGVVQDRYEQSLEELERELATAGSSARGQFQAAVGIDVSPRAGRLLRLINDIVGVKDEAEGHLTPELFAPDLPGLSVVELANLLDLLVRLGAIDRHSEARSTSDLPTTMIRVDPVVARVALG